jgi:hypothetical protein
MVSSAQHRRKKIVSVPSSPPCPVPPSLAPAERDAAGTRVRVRPGPESESGRDPSPSLAGTRVRVWPGPESEAGDSGRGPGVGHASGGSVCRITRHYRSRPAGYLKWTGKRLPGPSQPPRGGGVSRCIFWPNSGYRLVTRVPSAPTPDLALGLGQ